MTIIFAAGCCPLSGCAVAIGIDKAPDEIWEKLATGEQQDLIVEFNDSDVRTEAAQFSKARGIIFDDGETIRFKAQHIAAIKQKALSAIPSGEFEILRSYDVLPLMFVRFRTSAALRALLAQSSVVKVFEDRDEHLLLGNPKP